MKHQGSATTERNLKLFHVWAGRDVRLAWLPKLTSRLTKAEVFVVGGAVRDALLARKGRRDLDLVVRGVPIRTLQKELARLGRVDLVGRVFGVLKFVPKGHDGPAIDIALPRTDHALGTGGYRDVAVKADAKLPIEDDLARRDFTINAMAFDLKAGRLIDPFRGMHDLSKGIIRAVGVPSKRFGEDYSRMLRAIRFAVQLGFDVEPKTWRSVKTNIRHLLDQRAGVWVVPRETIAKEFLKSFAAAPVRAFDLMDESSFFRVLIPEVHKMKGCPQPLAYHTEGDVFAHTRLALKVLEKTGAWDALTVLGVLFHDIGKPPTLKTPERDGTDRVRFDGHDQLGATMTHAIVERLTLSAYKDPPTIDVDADRLAFIVRKHLFTVHGRIAEIRPTTIEKVFFRPPELGVVLLKVIYCDSAATIGRNHKADMGHFNQLKARIEHLTKKSKTKRELPKALITGEDVMRVLKIKPGIPVGEALRAVREAQLSGKVRTRRQAIQYVAAHH